MLKLTDRFAKKLRYFLHKGEFHFYNIRNKLFNTSRKVKLVAIAKNEGAYLCDWVFHHLYFGFDSIEIHVNNTDDNSWEIADKLKSNRQVKFINADTYFRQSDMAPQLKIYLDALDKSRQEGYSHVMFLDIDEYWTPKNLSTSIHDVLGSVQADIIAFQWFNRTNDTEEFAPVLAHKLEGVKKPQVKIVTRTNIGVDNINPHNIISRKACYRFVDGSYFLQSCDNYSKVSRQVLEKPLQDAFILHRINRSQLEYVAALSRGRPIQSSRIVSKFKDNRAGYLVVSTPIDVCFEALKLKKYEQSRVEFITLYDLEGAIIRGQKEVIKRFFSVVESIKSSPESERPVLKKVLENVDRKDVKHAYESFFKSTIN